MAYYRSGNGDTSGDKLNIGEPITTTSFSATIGQYFAIATARSATITGASIIKNQSSSSSGTVTYYTYLYIVKATATTVSFTTSGISACHDVIPIS